MWEIKGKNNQTKAIPSTKPEYNGEWMGECYVTVSVESPTPVNFEIGDYIIYRDERFEINYDPGKIKSAPRFAKGDAFKYENVKFNSLADELTRCDFLDVVLGDNQLHFTGLPKFSFYGNVQDLANRIQANLDRAYPNQWTVVVSPEYSGAKELNVSVDTQKVWDALSILVNDFETYFTIKGRTITIGAAGIPAGHLFKYGKGNGLYEIEQNAETDQAIVTRLRAYGSTRNLPHRYYNSLTGADGQKLIPDNMAVQYLMLPSFPYTTQDPYIDSANKAALGIREGTIFFDGSQEGLEEIYPSIEGMTAEQLKAAGVPCNSTGALDVLVSAEQMTDDGVGDINEGETETTATPPTFKVTLKDLGFDINDHLTTEAATLSFKTGMLGGRDFEIVGCKKVESNGKVTGYELELNRVYDDGIKLWFPYKDYNAKAGDKVVILHIAMPEVYIKAAAQRLLEAATAWLAKNDYSRSVYAPKIDEIFMARQHDEAMASGGTIASLHDTLKEGMLLLFEDEDLNIDASIFIDRLTIKEGDGPVPTYEVVLKEEKTVGRLDKMQNQIDSLSAGKGQGGGGYNAAQIRSMIDAYGGTRFLSKIKNDRTVGKVSSDKGFEVGKFVSGVAGGFFGMDANGDSMAEVARLYVRVKAFFEELTVIKSNVLAGKQYITPGGGITCLGVEELDDVYRCYFLSEQDGEKTETKIIAGDQAISEMFNAKADTANKVSNHRYWRLVKAVNNDAYTDDNGNHYGYIDLSKTDCESDSESDSESDIPQPGDEICQLGYRGTDKPERQTAMIFSTVDSDAPSIKMFSGIGSGATNAQHYSLADKVIISFGRDTLKGKIFFRLGATGATQYLEYTQAGGLEIAGAISTKSTIDSKPIGEYIKDQTGAAYLLDLTNEVAGIACDSNGIPVGNMPSTMINVYRDGITDTGWTFEKTDGNGCVSDLSGNQLTIQSISLYVNSASVSITATKAGCPTLTATMSIYKVIPGAPGQKGENGTDGQDGQDGAPGQDGKPATVFSLLPSVNSVTRHADGSLSAAAVTCTVLKTTGDATPTPSNEHILWYQRMPDGLTGTLSRTDGVSGGVSVLPSTEAIVFELRNGNTVLDRERVPVLSDLKDFGIGGENMVLNAGFTSRLFLTPKMVIDAKMRDRVGGVNVLKMELEGLTSDQWIGVWQNYPKNVHMVCEPNTYYSYRMMVYTPDIDSFDYGAAWELNVRDKDNNVIQWNTVDIKPTESEQWQLIEGKFKTPANASHLDCQWWLKRNGKLWVIKPQLVRGAVLPDWAPSPYDFDYVTEALKNSGSFEGGLLLGSHIKLGYTDSEGNYHVMAGLNGITKPGSTGREAALWGGGEMLDADEVSEGAATSMIRMDGTAYFAGNVIRLLKDHVMIGNDVRLDTDGLKLMADGSVKAVIHNNPVEVDFDKLVSKVINFGDTSYTFKDVPWGMLNTIKSAVAQTVERVYTIGAVTAETRVSCSVLIRGNQYFADLPEPREVYPVNDLARIELRMAGETVAKYDLPIGSTIKYIENDYEVISKGFIQYYVNTDLSLTCPTAGSYTLAVVFPQSQRPVAETVGNIGCEIRVKGNATMGFGRQTIIGSDGFASVWENAAIAVNKDRAILRAGGFGLIVDASKGIQYIKNGGSPQQLV